MFNAWAKQPFVLLSTVIALWVISPVLTFVGLVLVPLGIPCIMFLKRKIKDFVSERKKLLGVIEEVVSESIRSIRIVKVFGLEERNVDQLASAINKQRGINMKNAFYIGLMSPLSELIGFTGLAVIIFAGSQRIVDGSFTTGTFFVFIMAFLNIYRPLKDISNGFMNYQLALDAGRRLIILERRAAKARAQQGHMTLDRFDHMEIRDLWFAYGGDDTAAEPEGATRESVLKGTSLALHAGETVALVGATGAGKSTLCDLICRLYEPDRGELLVNGTPASAYSHQSYTAAFGLCSQDTIVFNNALLEEIRIAAPQASTDEVRRVADAVGLSPYLAAGRRNWESWIGDRGVQFSGGQRQMIAIARALLRKPQVLIMDEAMSGLDVETGRLLWQNIRRMLPGTTILAISHNWDVIRHCERVCVMIEGRISRIIPVKEIQDREQFFRSLHIERKESNRSDG
jgi:subfamily B ATP-binding cassette protein MsbA